MSEAMDDSGQREVHEVMNEALGPVALAPDREAAMKRRLFARVDAALGSPAADERGLITIRADAGDWQPFVPKVSMKVLMRQGDTLTYLLRLEPGAVVPPHDHPQTEECVVLSGEARIGDLVIRAGDYHAAPAGRPHGMVTSDEGALLFLRGVAPSAKQLRWGSLDTYVALIPAALRGHVGRRQAPE